MSAGAAREQVADAYRHWLDSVHHDPAQAHPSVLLRDVEQTRVVAWRRVAAQLRQLTVAAQGGEAEPVELDSEVLLAQMQLSASSTY